MNRSQTATALVLLVFLFWSAPLLANDEEATNSVDFEAYIKKLNLRLDYDGRIPFGDDEKISAYYGRARSAPLAPHCDSWPRAETHTAAVVGRRKIFACKTWGFGGATDGKNNSATDYKAIFWQDMVFLGIRTGFRLTEEKTRAELVGPFFRDWKNSLPIRGWDDGNKWFTNWVGHSAGGSVAAFIFAQNHGQSLEAEVGWNKKYLSAKSKQFIFSMIDSANFELGPISEASIGNVGLAPGKNAWIDYFMPTVGVFGWSVAEDIIDRYVVRRAREKNKVLGATLAVILNPTRATANVSAFRKPWYRHYIHGQK